MWLLSPMDLLEIILALWFFACIALFPQAVGIWWARRKRREMTIPHRRARWGDSS